MKAVRAKTDRIRMKMMALNSSQIIMNRFSPQMNHTA